MQPRPQGEEAEEEEEEGQVVRVLCPVDRIGDVSRLSVAGARIRFDCASASPFPSDRVLLISASTQQQQHDALQAALLSVFDRIFAPNYPPYPPYHHPHQQHHHHHLVSRLLLSPSSPILSMANANTLPHPAGAILRIFPKDHAFPAFTGPPHHLITITGSFPSVKNALLTLSPFLLDAPPPPTATHVLIPSQYLPFITASDGTHISHIQQMYQSQDSCSETCAACTFTFPLGLSLNLAMLNIPMSTPSGTAASPRMAISARIFPTAGPILNPWPEKPPATTTSFPNSPPKKSMMKSPSGVMEYMHACVMTGPLLASTCSGMHLLIHCATGATRALTFGSSADAAAFNPTCQSLLSGLHGVPPCMAILMRLGYSRQGVP